MTIKDWPEDDRPREKLLRKGAAVLSDAELLAIFLRVGIKGKSAVDLARDLLLQFGSLQGLFGANEKHLCQMPGIGIAKFVQFQAVLEIARRTLAEEMTCTDTLSSPKAVREYLRLSLQSLPHEVFVGVFLNAQNQVIASDDLSIGTLTQTSVYPREVVKRALAHNAASVIFAHNHPSGTTEPSNADRHLTRALTDALASVDIKVLDHFIVAPGSILSFAERGLLAA